MQRLRKKIRNARSCIIHFTKIGTMQQTFLSRRQRRGEAVLVYLL